MTLQMTAKAKPIAEHLSTGMFSPTERFEYPLYFSVKLRATDHPQLNTDATIKTSEFGRLHFNSIAYGAATR